MPIQTYWKIYHPKNEIFHIKILIFFLYFCSKQNIDCGYSLEPPRRGGSNEYPESMFLSRNKKNNVYTCKPQFYYIKMGLRGSKLYRRVFVIPRPRCMETPTDTGRQSFTFTLSPYFTRIVLFQGTGYTVRRDNFVNFFLSSENGQNMLPRYFLLEQILFQKWLGLQESKQEVTNLVSLVKMAETLQDPSSPFLAWLALFNRYHPLGIFRRRDIDCIGHIFPKHRIWHSMQIVPVAWNVKSCFLGKVRKRF